MVLSGMGGAYFYANSGAIEDIPASGPFGSGDDQAEQPAPSSAQHQHADGTDAHDPVGEG